MKDINHFSLLHHTTFGVEAEARRFVEFETVDELRMLLPLLQNQPFWVMGGGSNLLFLGSYEGSVVHSALKGIQVQDEGDTVLLTVASGEVWDDVVAYAVQEGWSGMENLSAIPGEVGASAVQNIGAYGVEVQELIVQIEAMEVATGQILTIPVQDVCYAYRQSAFKNRWKNRFVILSVTYRLQKSFQPRLDYGNIRSALKEQLGDQYEQQLTPALLRQVIVEIRRQKLPDPKVLGNAGSFFMNPVIGREALMLLENTGLMLPYYDVDEDRVKIPAGWLIEQCGWKGRRMGRVGVYDKQALILVNYGGATGQEVADLSEAICNDVKRRFGLTIRPEVNFIK